LTAKTLLATALLLLGFMQGRTQVSLEKVATPFYTDYIVIDTSGMKISLPYEIQKALFSPRFVSLCDSNYLYFSDADTVFEYDIRHRSKRELLRVSNGPHTLCGIAWSPDSSLAMILSIDFSMYETGSLENYLYLIAIDGSFPPKKYRCAVNFYFRDAVESLPGRDFYFIDNQTIGYKTHLESDVNPGKSMVVKTSEFKY